MGRILNVHGESENLSKSVNRVVKEQRGKSRPFVLVLVEEDGKATVASNMTLQGEVSALLSEVGERLRGT